MTTIQFQEISLRGVSRWIDEDGRRRQKTKKFSQTISPFNLDADKNVKTAEQIRAELKIERDQWLSGETR